MYWSANAWAMLCSGICRTRCRMVADFFSADCRAIRCGRWTAAALGDKEPQAGNEDRFAGFQILRCKGETAASRPHGDHRAVGMIGHQPVGTGWKAVVHLEPDLLRVVGHVEDFRLNPTPARLSGRTPLAVPVIATPLLASGLIAPSRPL